MLPGFFAVHLQLSFQELCKKEMVSCFFFKKKKKPLRNPSRSFILTWNYWNLLICLPIIEIMTEKSYRIFRHFLTKSTHAVLSVVSVGLDFQDSGQSEL